MASDQNSNKDTSLYTPCGICLKVLKDPVSCQHNEHLFCRACIAAHLMNSQTCPSCMEPLTIQSLKQAPQAVTNLLSEGKIRCQFVERGCVQLLEPENLKRHVTECRFAPNKGCQHEVNRQDLPHHETAVCEQRRVECPSCDEMKQELDTVKGELAAVNEKFEEVSERMASKMAIMEKKMAEVEKQSELVKGELEKQKRINCVHVLDNLETKARLNTIAKHLKRMAQHVTSESEKHSKVDGKNSELARIIIAAGWNGQRSTSSVEMFSFVDETWTLLQPIKEARLGASSVVYNNHVFLLGGFGPSGATKSIEILSLNAVHADPTSKWESILAELPYQLWKHCSVFYKERLIVVGGYDESKRASSDSIIEISLDPPYNSKLLAVLPETRWYHGVALFGNKILILGGKVDWHSDRNLVSVLLYDITKNECQELAPLPYPVSDMATVKLDDDNVILAGGCDSNEQPLKKVILYNIKSQKSLRLPDMKYNRAGCVGVGIQGTVVVMGGKDEKEQKLKSVECFRFDRYTWEELPEMHEARCLATAVVC